MKKFFIWFLVASLCMVGTVFASEKFVDVSEDDTYYDAVVAMSELGYFDNGSDTEFNPNGYVTTSEYLGALFTLVSGEYVSESMLETEYSNILNYYENLEGYTSSDAFNGFTDDLNRRDMVRYIVNFTAFNSSESDIMLYDVIDYNDFYTGKAQDVSKVTTEYGYIYSLTVYSAYKDGYIQPDKYGSFAANTLVTRAEAIYSLYNYAMLNGLIGNGFNNITELSLFSDVSIDSWYYDSLYEMSTNGYVSGYSDGTFLPNNNITAAEYLTMLVNLLDIKCPYVYGGMWYAEVESWCKDYIDGSGIEKLKMSNEITRGDVAIYTNAIAVGILDLDNFVELEEDLEVFLDLDTEDVLLYQSVAVMESLGFISGDENGNFNADDYITRAEAVSILSRLRK